MARSRRPFTVVMSGALRRLCAWRTDSQLPMRMPTDFALLTRAIPAASSGASRPLSAASAASLRIADIRIMIDDEPSLRSSRDTRQALTVALVKPGCGACWNPGQELLQRHQVQHRFIERELHLLEHAKVPFTAIERDSSIEQDALCFGRRIVN
jgi:hypothetical protein